jgi:hypothetical protein
LCFVPKYDNIAYMIRTPLPPLAEKSSIRRKHSESSNN